MIVKRLFDKIYIFSKFSLSFILLCCLIFTLYVLFLNYQKNEEKNKSLTTFEKDLNKSIINNSNQIKVISKEIEKTNLLLKNLETNLKRNPEPNEGLISINKNIKILNKKLTNLSNEIKKIKKQPSNYNSGNELKKSNIIDVSKNEIIDLIFLKYQNNLPFDKEFLFLEQRIKPENKTIFEKINILKEKSYKGHNNLEIKFKNELNAYLKKSINNNSNFFIKKIILPYVTIAPSTANKIDDDVIIKLDLIKSDIEKKDIEKAFKSIVSIKDHEVNFNITTNEMKKFLNFKREIFKLKQ